MLRAKDFSDLRLDYNQLPNQEVDCLGQHLLHLLRAKKFSDFNLDYNQLPNQEEDYSGQQTLIMLRPKPQDFSDLK